jgi:signal transduction histidine kinase
MVLGIGATKNYLEAGNLPEAGNLLTLIKKTSVGMVAEVRAIARMDEGQMPAELTQLGLEKSLGSFLQSFTGRFEPTLNARLPARRLSAEVEAALYFIAREAVNNVAKHANASRCAIAIEARQGDKAVMTIADNGRGPGQMFVPGAGMQSMRQRASDLGGTFEIGDNKPGTVLRVDIPLRNTD